MNKEGVYGLAKFGVISPEVNPTDFLNIVGVKYRYENNEGYQSILIPFEDGLVCSLDLVNYIDQRFKMNGTLCYGAGPHPEVTETMLGRMMNASGIIEINPERLHDHLKNTAKTGLEHMVDAVIRARKQNE